MNNNKGVNIALTKQKGDGNFAVKISYLVFN